MSLSLLDWRRRVAELYVRVRAADDSEVAWNEWRRGRDLLFSEHPDSPVDQSSFQGLRYRPYEPAFRFVIPIIQAEPVRIEIPTATDGLIPFRRLGRLELPGIGSLDVWWLESYGGGIFLPVKDATCGRTSYGGGRYVLDTVKGADLGQIDGDLIIDLNFSYNPSCAYDPRWVCPLPPAGNVVQCDLDVGELAP
jgi:uncharacterized protein (DUF1684 family)